ncbi:hypothetical protein BATDEDRAFT_88099 [Batrachochytrium dendrobatidis JAM81]|uniref:Oxysterol-binding protein n=2 Tax=Batrachochytrium dendrobatidis TaxID=109871 RepID=F4P211_BATDJ|nr:uncharacterized protein BATDEDRAFT_88099 [Batrachochytrium dendrobatidis JAM81]EGF81032.1 hypothetical protein BATDEDRAFT_88099 [Batrachochytrium dendrobatidis JAM81]KAJ8329034.1 Oxysterol-binding protein OBPa [Batrachochytrium dendrobatidis]KAK5668982.1 Oxysterol-binding protein OBPa [Batrachochytrium dendrobatidis]OAJ41907.1 hypothetical protein BDEG_25436 [Batrachochytrium dendrobatidis JEL423]|eukprot:XP_006678791.1 hypothetical protein BATDEDRAFT_88099 [Batrachochytrium dendrobatidis JAM81]
MSSNISKGDRSGSALDIVANADATNGSDQETEVLDEEPRSILMGVIAQLSKGMDLHRVTLPTFVLEPRSMCERISDFLAHQTIILSTSKKDDPIERFIDVLSYFFSGWHIRPKGVKKPFNPVLGEIFRCHWSFQDATESFFVCEQVLHHPPVSAYFFSSPENDVTITGELKPRARFLGNSAATIMEGGSTVTFPSRPGESYDITSPNVYARGILFGTMYIELGDTAIVRCAKTDLICNIEFKTKGYFGGCERNAIAGKIKRESTGEILYKVSGCWSEQIWLQSTKSGDKRMIFDAISSALVPKQVADILDQEEFESRRLWQHVAKAVTDRDLDMATLEKSKIEDNQRLVVKDREATSQVWEPRFFSPDGENWKPKFMEHIPTEAGLAKEWLRETIFSKATTDMHVHFWSNK